MITLILRPLRRRFSLIRLFRHAATDYHYYLRYAIAFVSFIFYAFRR